MVVKARLLLILLLPTFFIFSGVFSETVHFKGNLLYTEYGANYLNQEHLILSRRLETADLQIYAQTYQDSSNIYISFCDSLERLYFKINPQFQPPPDLRVNQTFTTIASPTKHPISQAAAVCRTLGAHLPEVRNRNDDRDLLEIFDKHHITVAMANINFNIKTQKFYWESDIQEVRNHTVYNKPYYGGRNKDQWYQAESWLDPNLVRDAGSYFMTYVKAKDGIAFRLSDSGTLDQMEYIVCQKPIPYRSGPADIEANILIQMTRGICLRDKQSILETTKQALEQIELITTLKLDIKRNSSSLDNYLPAFQTRKKRWLIPSRIPPTPFQVATIYITNPPIYGTRKQPPNSKLCLKIDTTSDLWNPLWQEIETKEKLVLSPPLANNITHLIESAYNYWFHILTKNKTSLGFHTWVDSQLDRLNFSTCSQMYRHVNFSSTRPLYDRIPRSLPLFRQNANVDYLSDPRNPFDYKSSHRPTRDLGVMAGATVMGTIIGGTAYVIRSFIDLFSTNKYASKADFAHLSHNIEDLRINQVELQSALRQISVRMSYYENVINDMYNGIAAQAMEMDIKSFNRYLHNVLVNTLNSYAQAFLAAMDGKTSPYALSPVELAQLRNDFHVQKGLTLDTNINNVKTTALILENTIRFIFEVPIVSEDSAFTFYSVTPIPSFNQNITYWPDIEQTNIAISKDGSKYTILSQEEVARCMHVPPVCNSRNAISPVSNKASCIISTYTSSKRTCPLKASSSPVTNFLHFIDTSLFYSVPQNTTLFISCPSSKQFSSPIEKSVTIYGMGEAHYRPSCTITLPDGTFRRTPKKPEIHDLSGWPLFNIKSALPHSFEGVINLPTTLIPIFIPEVPQEEDSIFSFPVSWKENNGKTYEVLASLGSLLGALALVIAFLFCFRRKIKMWVENKIYQGTHSLNRHTETAKDEFTYSSPLTPIIPHQDFTLESPVTYSSVAKSAENLHLQKDSNMPPPILKAQSQRNVQFSV